MKINFLLFLIIIQFFSITTNGQVEKQHSILFSEKDEMNLKGCAKSVIAYYTKIKETLPKTVRADVIGRNGVFIPYQYIEFDKDGIPVKYILGKPEFEKPFDWKGPMSFTVEYDKNDIKNKEKIKATSKYYYPSCDYSYDIFIKPNVNRYFFSKELSNNDSLVNKKKLVQHVHKYKLDKLKRITEDLEYLLYPTDTIPIKIYNKTDWKVKVLFFYNNINQLISQKFFSSPYKEDEINIDAFSALDTESGFSDDLQLKYKYDKKGRMTQALFYGSGQTIASEDYIYHPTMDYIEKVKCYVTGLGEIGHRSKNFIKTYNEYRDLIEIEYLSDNPNNPIGYGRIKYYMYEYDLHGNWIKCKMYLEGTKDGEPTLVAERKIEYFE